MFLGTYIESVWQVGDNGCIGLILRQRVFDHRWACYALAECMIIRFVHSGVVILAQNTRRHTACSEQNFVDTSSVLEDSSSFRVLKVDFTWASLRCGCYATCYFACWCSCLRALVLLQFAAYWCASSPQSTSPCTCLK